MGLISEIYNMSRQSELDERQRQMDEFRKQQLAQDYELKKRKYEMDLNDYNTKERSKSEVMSGLGELGIIDRSIAETSLQKTVLEQQFEQASLRDPDEAKGFLIESQVIAKRLEDLNNIRRVKGAELTYKSIDGGYAKAKALDLADFLNGKDASESGMATVTKKRKVLDEDGMDTGETETVTMKVPQSQAGYGGYVGGGATQAQAPQPSSYNPYSMAGAMIDSTAPLGYATPEYARPYAPEQSQRMLMRDIANVPVQSPAQDQSQAMQAQPQADTEAVRQQALSAMSRAQTPEQRQKIKDRAAQMGVNLP
jgi:hypothetical protein